MGLPSSNTQKEKQQKSEYRRASCIFFSMLSLHVKKINDEPDHLQSALIIGFLAKNGPRHILDKVVFWIQNFFN